jgi:AcrR family transcriptional regulator
VTAPTRTDLRRERTRRALIDAGRTLIAEHGVAGLRIQDITAEADIALGSFYNYFPTKEELVEAVVADSLVDLGAQTVVGDESQDPAVTAAAAIRTVVRLAFDQPEFARLLVNLHHADTLFAQAFHPFARQVVERGVEQGRFRSPDLEVSVNFVVGSSLSLIRSILEGQHEDGVERIHAELSLRALGIDGDEARALTSV